MSDIITDCVQPPAGEGAGRNTRGRVCSPTPTALFRLRCLTAALVLLALRPSITARAESAGLAGKFDWWSFKPAVRSAPPELQNSRPGLNSIDKFILARLAEHNLSPSPEADRTALIRRLYFDLTGLPPTPDEVRAFLSSKDPKAYESLADRLLASPRYGERWARHWLDVIHYGESHGYDKDKPRTNAWPYRDYLIRSFNADKPYSRFVEEQLAGDVLFPDDPEGIVAIGFIAAGPWDFVGHVELPESKTDGLIARYNDRDDMVMTAMSTFQSLTVHCARCHDHKFDPITQKEYYGLQSVFAGVDRADRPFDTDRKTKEARDRLTTERQSLEKRRQALAEQVAQIHHSDLATLDQQIGEAKHKLAPLPKPKSPSNGYHSGIESRPDVVKWVQVELPKEGSIEAVRLIPARPTDFPDTPGFGFPKRFRVEIAKDATFANPIVLQDHSEADVPNPRGTQHVITAKADQAQFVRVTATRLWERTADYVFALAELQVIASGSNVAERAAVTALDSIEAGRWGKAHLVDGFDSRARLTTPQQSADPALALETRMKQLQAQRAEILASLIDPKTREEIAEVEASLTRVANEQKRLPTARMVYAAANDFVPNGSFKPAKGPRPVHLLARGDVKQPRELMMPAGLAAVPGPDPQFSLADPQNEGSRRAALAKWITHPKNMLTRRSIVNRVWQYHFGRGLVDTPNDFGHMGSLPTHPALLDWLAFWFLDNGESLHKLHRLILTSAAYRQSSAHRAACDQIDGENRFLWRMNRTRLDAESIRDSMLFIAGQLDLTMGGPSAQQFYFKDDHSPIYDYTRFDLSDPGSHRRSVYRFIVRSVPDPFMDSLDCPDSSLLTPKRNATMTALQALAVLNNPFVIRQSESLARRASESGRLSEAIESAHWLVLSRTPTVAEMEKLSVYAKKHGLANMCRVLFNSSEFMFVD